MDQQWRMKVETLDEQSLFNNDQQWMHTNADDISLGFELQGAELMLYQLVCQLQPCQPACQQMYCLFFAKDTVMCSFLVGQPRALFSSDNATNF